MCKFSFLVPFVFVVVNENHKVHKDCTKNTKNKKGDFTFRRKPTMISVRLAPKNNVPSFRSALFRLLFTATERKIHEEYPPAESTANSAKYER